MSNTISLLGRLGRDSERKSVGSSTVLEFSVGEKVGYGDNVIPGAGVAERLGISEHQLKLGAEGARQVAHGGVRGENSVGHRKDGH